MNKQQPQWTRTVWKKPNLLTVEEAHGKYFVAGFGWLTSSEMEAMMETVGRDIRASRVANPVGPSETK